MHKGALLGLLPALVLGQSNDTGTLTASMIEGMGNNSLFTRWRPTSHFIAPAGWMNDPCGAMYDPMRDMYHLFYQWHPEHINWGNISWGHATSKDMITWTDVGGWQDRDAIAIGTGGVGNYNGLGIFSGTAQPVNLTGGMDGTIIAMYTSVAHLPTSWNAPYIPHTESQSFAMSTDGGMTWEEYSGNPVITQPPGDWNITGWRDPFLEPWPAMDDFLNQTEPHYYAVFGSGIKGVGPRIPFYSAPASNLTDWTFLGALWEPTMNTSLGPVLSTGSYGFNMEVSGFFSLPDSEGNLHYYVNMGTEGGNVSFHEASHWALWNEGYLMQRDNGSAQFNPIAGSAADWGNLYALTSFNDTKNNRRVQWGWAPEDLVGDGGLFSAKQQGFQGSHGFPRELFVHETSGLVNADSQLTKSGVFNVQQQANGTFTSRTLGIRPLSDVIQGVTANASYTELMSCDFKNDEVCVFNSSLTKNSLLMETQLTNVTGPAGVVLAIAPDMSEYTTIYFDPSNYTLNVDRSYSSSIEGFNNATVVGYFYPYTMMNADGSMEMEPVNMQIMLDGSLLEIFINGRFALTTRIYPGNQNSTGLGLYYGSGANMTASAICLWSDLGNVWPERPANSSSPLVWDTAAQTGNYTWWSGN